MLDGNSGGGAEVSGGTGHPPTRRLVDKLRAAFLTPLFPELRSRSFDWLGRTAAFFVTTLTSRAAITLAFIWFGLATAGLLLASVLDRSSFRAESLPGAARWALLCHELVLLTIMVLVIGAPLTVVREGWFRKRRSDAASYRIFAFLTCGAAITLASLYVISWVTFWSWGSFLDLGSVRFWIESPLLVIRHVAQLDPLLLAAVPLVLLAGMTGAVLLHHRLVTRPVPIARLVPVAASIIALLAHMVSTAGKAEFLDSTQHTWDREAGPGLMLGDHFAALRADRTGPLSRIFSDLRGALAARAPTRGVLANEFVTPPIVGISEYLAEATPRPLADAPNVVLIVIESLAADQLLAYGANRDVMPNINGLARAGRVFTDHISTASHSNYASVVPLSGHYPLRSPRYHLYPRDPTYPRVMIYDILKALGYRTAIFSSQNEVWGGMLNYLDTGGIDHLLHSETYTGPTYVPSNDIGFVRFVKGTKRSGKIDDRYTVQEAMEWVRHGGAEPFFIYMNLQTSHVPYEVPADFPPRFGTGRTSFPIRFNSFPRDSVAAVIDVYANSLAYVDFQLGRFFDELRALGVWENTLVVVTGDHGQAFFEHGFAAHSNQLYDELLRTPLIFAGPGITPGSDDRPAQHVDVPPSVLGLLGLPLHPGHQGVDLFAPEFDAERSRFAVVQSPMAHQYAVVRSGYKLIRDVRRDSYRLFDLVHDPGEQIDLAARLPEVVARLREELDSWSSAQFRYYADKRQQRYFYPPRLEDR